MSKPVSNFFGKHSASFEVRLSQEPTTFMWPVAQGRRINRCPYSVRSMDGRGLHDVHCMMYVSKRHTSTDGCGVIVLHKTSQVHTATTFHLTDTSGHKQLPALFQNDHLHLGIQRTWKLFCYLRMW